MNFSHYLQPTSYTPYQPSTQLTTTTGQLTGPGQPGPSYFPPFPHASLPQPPLPSIHRPPSPDPLPMTPEVASETIQRLILSELRNAGFEKSESAALSRLEHEVVAMVQKLYQQAHEYGNLANRSTAIATDLIQACGEHGLTTKDLRVTKAKAQRKRRKLLEAPTELLPRKARSPSPKLLDSDDEGATPAVPTTLRQIPTYLPSLPPRHTYLQTPASPPKRAALPSLEKKLKTASLVQESLRNLMLSTEDRNQEDAELLGHFVNWESTLHPRKRWKVGV